MFFNKILSIPCSINNPVMNKQNLLWPSHLKIFLDQPDHVLDGFEGTPIGIPSNIVSDLRAAVVYAVTNVPSIHLIIECSQFWQCIDVLTVADGGFNEWHHPLCMWSSVRYEMGSAWVSDDKKIFWARRRGGGLKLISIICIKNVKM